MAISTTYKQVGSKIKEISVVTPEDQVEANIIKYINSCNFQSKLEARTKIYGSKDPILPTVNEKALALQLIDDSDMPDVGPMVTAKEKAMEEKLKNFTFVDAPKKQYSPFKVHFFVKQGFYLLYDGGVCYLKTKPDDEYPVELVVKTEGGFPDASAISAGGKNFKFRNMTQSEYDAIVKANPLLEDVLKVYQRRFSDTTGFGGALGDNRLKKVNFNFNNLIAVF